MFGGQAIQCPQVSSWVRVTITELVRADRDLVEINVKSGGGEYSGVLDTETNVLMCGTAIDESVAIVYPFPTSRKNLLMKYIIELVAVIVKL